MESPGPEYERISRAQLVADIEEADLFLKSRLYSAFLFTMKEKREAVDASILHSAPITLDQMIERSKLYGEREALDSEAKIFEEHRTGLEQLLSTLDESQPPTVRQ